VDVSAAGVLLAIRQPLVEVYMATEEEVRKMAYALWEQEGRPEGRDLEFYFRAQPLLEKRKAVVSSATEPVPSSPPQAPAGPIAVRRRRDRRRSRRV
jgi:hypothetical protein